MIRMGKKNIRLALRRLTGSFDEAHLKTKATQAYKMVINPPHLPKMQEKHIRVREAGPVLKSKVSGTVACSWQA